MRPQGLRRCYRLTLAALLVSALELVAPTVSAQAPRLPAAYAGTIQIYGQPDKSDLQDAPIGGLIEARAGGVSVGQITITQAGRYGDPSNHIWLVVQGDIPEGGLLEFYWNGTKADQTDIYISGSVNDAFNLTVFVPSLAPTPTPTPTPTPRPTARGARSFPDPATWALMLSGIALLGFTAAISHRRRQS